MRLRQFGLVLILVLISPVRAAADNCSDLSERYKRERQQLFELNKQWFAEWQAMNRLKYRGSEIQSIYSDTYKAMELANDAYSTGKFAQLGLALVKVYGMAVGATKFGSVKKGAILGNELLTSPFIGAGVKAGEERIRHATADLITSISGYLAIDTSSTHIHALRDEAGLAIAGLEMTLESIDELRKGIDAELDQHVAAINRLADQRSEQESKLSQLAAKLDGRCQQGEAVECNIGDVEKLAIPADGTAVSSETVLADGFHYQVVISGTFRYDVGEPGQLADAQHYEDDSHNWQRENWVAFDGVRLDASDSDQKRDSYTYQVPGRGDVMSFRIVDSGYSDNEGALSAEIHCEGE